MATRETWPLRREIYATRGELDRYLEELQRRRRELMDVKLQVRRHPGLVIGLGAVVAAAVGAAVWKARQARKQRAVPGIGRALSGLRNLGGASRDFSDARRGGHLFGFVARAGVPLGIALAKGLFRHAGAAGPRSRGC
jgi:hypothetical protein